MIHISLHHIAIFILVFMTYFGGHWIRWHVVKELVDENKQLRLLYRYAFGVGFIFIGFIALSPQDNEQAIFALVISIIAAGLGTKCAYHVDSVLEDGADKNSTGLPK